MVVVADAVEDMVMAEEMVVKDQDRDEAVLVTVTNLKVMVVAVEADETLITQGGGLAPKNGTLWMRRNEKPNEPKGPIMQNAILELSVVWSQVKNKSLMTSLNQGQREHNLLISLLQVTS